MDETGFQIGMGKDHLVITKRKRSHYFSIPQNRESATAIECISASGCFLPAFLILSGKAHMRRWYEGEELEPKSCIAISPTGFTNDEVSLDWLKHFDLHSKGYQVGVKRLLIIDGHGSHHTIEFISYCYENNIIQLSLPPHLTHILQPLDVAVFQPLKGYYAKALDVLVRDGCTNITKLEFLSVIHDVRRKALKPATILSAFKKTGIVPFNPLVILRPLRDRQAVTPDPEPASGEPQSSPFTIPQNLRQINKLARDIQHMVSREDRLHEGMVFDIENFVEGSLQIATELVQVKRDLGRTEMAKLIARKRRAGKNTTLKSGGILTVEDGRAMVSQQDEDSVSKAQKIVDRAHARYVSATKRAGLDAAKMARKWRFIGRLSRLEIHDGSGFVKFLKRA